MVVLAPWTRSRLYGNLLQLHAILYYSQRTIICERVRHVTKREKPSIVEGSMTRQSKGQSPEKAGGFVLWQKESWRRREKGIEREFDAKKGRERIGFGEELSSLMKGAFYTASLKAQIYGFRCGEVRPDE